MTLPMVPGWQQVTASVTPMAMTMTPAPVAGQYSMALCNQCTTSWFPPPLPPVPCELTARLEALEHEVHPPQFVPEPGIAASDSRLERTVESLRKQLAVSEAAAARSAALEAQLEKSHLDEKLRVNKLEASAEAGKMTAAQEAELHTRTGELLKQQSMASEAYQLRQDLEAACRVNENEQRARDELERMHSEVVAENARLQADFQKLQGDYEAERRAKQEVSVRHEAVEADARNFKLDLERLRSAHDLELHSTRADFQSRHQAVEELAKKLQADLQQMELDRARETQAHLEVQQKFDAVFADAEKLRADVLHVQAARDAEQHAREDVELKHRLAEAGNEQLRRDLQHLQVAHDANQRGRQDAEGRCGAAEIEVERVRAALNQQLQMAHDAQDRSREEASRSTRDLAAAEFRVKELSAENASERALAASHRSTIDEHRVLLQKARETEGALWSAEEKVRTYEARLSGMQTEIEELRSRLIGVEAERDQLSFDKSNLQRTKEQRGEMDVTLRERLEAERDQLQNDIIHLKKANQMRQDSEMNLRQGIEDERNTVRELKVQVENLEHKLELKAHEFRETLELKERELSDTLQRQSKAGFSTEERLLQVQQKLRAVEVERDTLQSDALHLHRAMEQREESESSLRKGIEEERKTVLELRNKLETLESKLQNTTAELEEQEREARTQLAAKELELRRLKEARDGKDDVDLQRPAAKRALKRSDSKNLKVSFVSSGDEDIAEAPNSVNDQSRDTIEVDLTDDMGPEVAPREVGEEGTVMEVDLTDEMDGPSWGESWGAQKSEFWDMHEEQKASSSPSTLSRPLSTDGPSSIPEESY